MTDIEQLISNMTMDEKISLLAGEDVWHTVPVSRLGVPFLKVTDGPNGVRGASRDIGPPTVCLPVGMALGATWNVELIERLGGLLAEAVKLKNAHVLLAPTVNIHRTPIAGRNFECFSEDPYLSGRMATAYINGLQNNGVAACIKHFVCNEQEYERTSMSSEVQERPLREIYLEPFRLAVRDANPWSLMTGYNKVNGIFASENDYTLKTILKGEWGYDGLVMSDWFGTYTPQVPAGGVELEMPGPARWMGAEYVYRALDDGDLTEEALDEKVRRILRAMERVGAFTLPEAGEERGENRPQDRALIREAAQETIVLLDNKQGILPLDTSQHKRIAVIGELARWPNIMGGGSSQVKVHYTVSPLEGIRSRAGSQAEVSYEPGCFIHKTLPMPDPETLTAADGSRGLNVAFYDNLDLSGEPAFSSVTDWMDFGWFENSVPQVNQERFSFLMTGFFTPQESGLHTFGLDSVGQSRLFLDGELLVDNWTRSSPAEKTVQRELTAGQAYPLKVEFRWEGSRRWRSVSLGHLPPYPADLMGSAVALARESDVVIVLAGLTREWESEGYDRENMDLPGEQNELIEQMVAANPNTIVVLNAGSAVTMPWLDKVAAVVDQWYNSQECGNALADILFGDVSPSGKLPTTFPRRLEDNPAFINYPGENGQVLYGEGLFVGYRYYDKKELEPLFPFGYGLSYTTFEYRDLQFSSERFTAGEGLEVQVEIHNSGSRAGKEIVQLYVHDCHSALVRPEKELKAFTKVSLEPGQSQTVTFRLDQEAFWYYDPAKGGWQTEPGAFEILVGGSSRDIRLRGTVQLVVGEGEGRLHRGLPLRELLANERSHAVLKRHFGEMLNAPALLGVMDQTLEQLAKLAPDILTAEKMDEIEAEM